MPDLGKLPSYAFLPPEAAQRRAERTRNGFYNLLPAETKWRDRQPELKQRGYTLRPRYQQNWEPSWIGTNINPTFCEDSVLPLTPNVIDATSSDGAVVAIKFLRDDEHEAEIAQFLTSLRYSENHCVPVIDVFADPLDPKQTLIVMPYLRPFNDPEFSAGSDIIDFICQMLEGLAFMHAHKVVHRDIAPPNVMMDGTPLYPGGHHPVRRDFALDGIEELQPLDRIDHPVRYFYIDFGLSVRFSDGSSSLVVGDVGRCAEVPELSSTVPYNGYKADIYALGDLFDKELEQKFHDLEFLRPLIECMKRKQPDLRPPASELVIMFKQIRACLNDPFYRRRLSPKSEPTYERFFNDTVAFARVGLSQLKGLVR